MYLLSKFLMSFLNIISTSNSYVSLPLLIYNALLELFTKVKSVLILTLLSSNNVNDSLCLNLNILENNLLIDL